MEPTPVAPAPYGMPPQFVMMPVAQRNGLGVFGFFVSLVGLVVPTGVVALLGLVLSLAAIGRSPRGFATSGVVLGLLGTLFWLVVMFVAVVVALVAALVGVFVAAAAVVLTQPEAIEITGDMVNTAMAIEQYENEHSAMPDEIGALALGVATTIDPWGKPYRLEIVDEEPGFDLVSSGPDGAFDTDDDVRLSRLDDFWTEALEGMEDRLADLGRRFEHADHGAHARSHRAPRTLTEAERYESIARREILATTLEAWETPPEENPER